MSTADLRELRRLKNELEHEFKQNPKPDAWTIEVYTKIYELCGEAVRVGLDDLRDQHQIGAVEMIQQVQRACEAYEALEIQRRVNQKEQKILKDQQRIENGKKLITADCSRILAAIEKVQHQTWDTDIVGLEDLNGPIIRNTSIRDLAKDTKRCVHKIKSTAYDIQTTTAFDSCYAEIQKAKDLMVKLDHKIKTEIQHREAKRQAFQQDQESSEQLTKQQEEEKKAKKIQDQEQQRLQGEASRRQKFKENSEKRIENLNRDVATMLRTKSRQLSVATVDILKELEDEKVLQDNDSEYKTFQRSLFASSSNLDDDDDLHKKDSDPANISPGVLKGLSKLKASRQHREHQKHQRELDRRQKLEHLKVTNVRTQELKEAKRQRQRQAELVAKQKLARETRARFDVGSDDPEEETRARAEARRALMVPGSADLWHTVELGDLARLKQFFLVEGSQELIARHNPHDTWRTLLHTASWYGQVQMVEFLLTMAAPVNVRDSVYSQTTALMEASRAGHSDICRMLIEYGANPMLQDAHGDTALHWAARRGWGSLLVSIVKWSESYQPGSTKGIFDIENHKGHLCLSVVKNETIPSLVKKELGVVLMLRRGSEFRHPGRRAHPPTGQGRPPKRIDSVAQMNQALSSLLEEEDVVPSSEYQSFVQQDHHGNSRKDLQQLSELGLDLASFTYSR